LIPETFIQELLARVDIVDVVERYLPLRKAGANFSACCPFHSEKTPSFTVSPTKQFYHCFGCGAHGSAIGFVMQYSGLGFVEAVEDLAANIGLTVPREQGVRHLQASEQKAPLTDVMARAAKYYREQLKASAKAVEYLKQRGLSGDIAARFGIGYAPDGWQNLDQVFPDYINPALLECGLVVENEQGRRYDRFRDRVMFPILDQRGNVIAFGGRVIGSGEPKYLNSPETPLFEKGRELFGLPQARKAIHDADTVIVVEGYMDVVGLAQLGVENVVASLGTATTSMHVQKLLKLANRVVFCFDRDEAGDKAAWRAMEASLEQLVDHKTVEILQMPGDQDPDEYIREHGREAFLGFAKSATKLSEFMLRELSKRTRPFTAEGRAQLVHEAKPLLQRISAPVLRVQMTKAIANLAQLTQAEMEAQCGLRPLARRTATYSRSQQRPAAQHTEHKLLEIVLVRPEWAARLPLELIPRDRPEGALLHALARAIEHGELPATGFNVLLEHFRGSEHEAVIADMAETLAGAEVDAAEMEAVLADSIAFLRQKALMQEIEDLNAKQRSTGLSAEERQSLLALHARKASGGRKTD
jgi:DNA primase